MQNENDSPTNPDIELIERAAKQLYSGGGLDVANQIRSKPENDGDAISDGQMTNDDVYDFIQGNRDRSFDTTTPEGELLYLQFEEANKRRNNFTFNNIRQMVNIISGVPADLINGAARNLGIGKDAEFTPQRIPLSIADGVARDVRDLVGLLTQSEDPSSPLFWAKDLINGTGTVKSRMEQFNEARWWGNRSNELEEGKADILSEWVPDNYKETARKLIDRKFANALSYIGLDAPHMIRDAWKRKGLGGLDASVKAFKNDGDLLQSVARDAVETADWFDNNAAKFARLSKKLTGEAMVGTAAVVSKPFEMIKERVLRGSEEIETRVGHIPNEISNGATTLMTDTVGAVTKDVELGPFRGILFSLGVKPIAEYASVFGNELIDAANGVVSMKGGHVGQDLMGRLALNGGRIAMSKEAQVVAKFTNVVVGWPASMAFPTFKRAVGDAAYMGVLGYLNARGEGASSGMGVGFAWGGLSGGLRHIHNVYNHSIAHSRIIENFDNAQLPHIYKQNPKHAEEVRSFLKFVDSKGDKRVSATVRAQLMAGHAADAKTEIRFRSANEMIAEFGADRFIRQVPSGNAKGAHLTFDGKDILWLNSDAASPETLVHEYSHRFLDILFRRNDNSAREAIRSFFGVGTGTGEGPIPDALKAIFIGEYSKDMFKLDDAWLNGSRSAATYKDQDGNVQSDAGYGNKAYALEQVREIRKRLQEDPENMFTLVTLDNGASTIRLFKEFPIAERLMHEVFAYNQSNSLLRRSPDIFLRNPAFKTIRSTMENWFTLLNQRKVNDLETAGILIRKKQAERADGTDESATLMESIFWDDGKFMSMGLLDSWSDQVMKDVLRHGDVNVMTLSGDRLNAYMNQTGKQRFMNGGRIKTKKEIEAQITADADAIAATLDALPDAVKPKWNVLSNGTKRVRLTELSSDAWKAIEDSGIYSKAEFDLLKGMSDVISAVDAGKPVFNTFTGQYLGNSKQVVEAALGERLKGSQVPVTLRHFAPFSIELIVSKFDELGNPLKNPRSHVTVHAMDVSVLNKRKMNQWQKSEVKALFRDFGHFSETFVYWFEQHSLDASQRKPSADYLRPEFGANAERVRDIMYETWGGRKRNDESYINAPEGYAGGRDGPLYPIHSLRFDLLANVLKQSQIFPEAFGGNLGALRYHEGVAYEPMRRNAMVGSFVQRELANGRRFYTDGNGYEIRGEEPKLKLFNMFGNLVGVFKTMAKAQAAAERNLKRQPKEEVGLSVDDFGDAPIVDRLEKLRAKRSDVYAGRSNLMLYKDKNGEYVNSPLKINHSKVRQFANTALSKPHSNYDPNQVHTVKLSDLIDGSKEWSDVLGPAFDKLEVTYSPLATLHGGVIYGLRSGAQGMRQFGVDPQLLHGKGIESFKAYVALHLQSMIALKQKDAFAMRTALASYDPDFMNMVRFSNMMGNIYQQFRADQSLETGFMDPMANLDDAEKFSKWAEDRIAERREFGAIQMLLGNKPARTIPSWVTGSITDSSGKTYPRYAQGLFERLNMSPRDASGNPTASPYSLMPNSVKADLNDWACTMAETFMTGKSWTYKMGTMFITSIDYPVYELPVSVKNFLSTVDQSKYPTFYYDHKSQTLNQHEIGWLNRQLQEWKTEAFHLHAITKVGDRSAVKGQNKPLNDLFVATNQASAKDTIGPVATGWINGVDVEFKADDSNMPLQALRLLSGAGMRSLVLIDNAPAFQQGMGQARYAVSMSEITLIGAHNSEFDPATNTNKLVAGGMTTDPAYGLTNPMHSLLQEKGGVEMPTDVIAASLGVLPFSGSRNKGSLHAHYENGWHLSNISEVANALGIQVNPAQDFTMAGLQNLANNIFTSGIDSAEKMYLHQVVTGAMQVEMGRSVINGDPTGLYQKIGSLNGGKGINANITDYGQGLVDRGYAVIIHAAASASKGSVGIKAKDIKVGGDSSILSAAFDSKGLAAGPASLNKKIQNSVRMVMYEMSKNGYDPEKISQTYGAPANLMLGGMRARELDMIKTGAMRFVKTDSGKMYKAFEFSDKEATLLTDKVGGKLHLLPFSKGGEADFDAYYKDFMRSQAPMMSTDALKLGELIDHKILFTHYPSLKDVRVEWEYGYGAHYNPDADVITLGIDRYIGKAMHERGSPDHLDYASFGIDFERKALDTILHEVQHAIQKREQWTDSASTASSAVFKRAGLILANNIAGVAGRTLSTERVVNDSGRVFFTDDPSSAPTQFDNRQVIQSIVKMAGSPMHLHLRQYAFPNLVKVSEEVMLGLADAHMHHPSGHMSRINAEKLSKKIGSVRAKAIEAMESFKRGDLREVEAKDIVCEHVMELESLIESGVGMLSVENSPIADRLYNNMTNALKYMRGSMQALNAFQIISRMADSGTHGMDVGAFSAKAREIFDTISMMQYLSQRHEIEADLTERRSQMTQEELNSTGINPDMTRANALDAISGAMDIGYAGNSIRAIGIALKNKAPIRVANLMIGGTGDAKLKPEERSNDALKLMARGTLVSWVVKTLQNELSQLNAVAFYGRGWEVGKDGVPRLTFKQGVIRLKGSKSESLDKSRYEGSEHDFSKASIQQQGSDKLGIFNAIARDGQTTITIQDIARIIDGIVVNESELATPSEAMDIIIRDDFPSVVNVKDLPKILKDRGISEDGLILSNAILFSQVSDADLPQTLTKGELIDVMAIVHRQLVHERTATRSVASGVINKAKVSLGEVTPIKLLEAIDKTYPKDGYYDTEDAVRKFADVVMGRIAFPEQFGTQYRIMGPQSGDNPSQNRYGMLNINYTSGSAVLNPVRPDFVEPAVWDQLVEKWRSKGYLDLGFFGMKQSLTDTDAERAMKEKVMERARVLNKNLTRKLFLLKPFYEKALAKIEEGLDESHSTETKAQFMALKFSLLDEASLAMIDPDLAGFRTSMNIDVGSNTHRQFGGSLHYQDSHTSTNFETTRTYNQLGIAPAIYASGYSPEVRDAFVELQTLMPMVGFSSEATIHSGTPTNYYTTIGGKEIHFYSLIDDLGERNFAADPMMQDNLMSITTSAVATKTLAEKIIAELASGDDGMTREQLQPMRFLVSIAERASTLAESATLLVGDVHGPSKEYINRNIQRERVSTYAIGNKFIQELSLLRGYRGADGTLVLQENLMADTSAAITHQSNMEIPVWNHSLLPAAVASRDYSAPAVQAIVMKDLAARSILFGAINDGAGNVTRPMSYIAPLSELAATIARTQNGGAYSERGVLIDGSVAYTSGLHALHSAMYLASYEKGVSLVRPLTADADFYRAWAQPSASGMFHEQHAGGHTIESFAIGLAPFLATAMTEKLPMLKDGALVAGDILSVEQRALLKAAREAYKGYDFANRITPEMDAARKAFFESLDSQQVNAIITHLSSGNVGYGLITMLGVMNAYQQIKRLPDGPAVSAALGSDVRTELTRQLDMYLTEGRYITEQGVNDVGGTVAMFDKGVTHAYIGQMTSSVFSDPITQNAVLAAWSVMDSSATAYVPDMVNGEPSLGRPHTSLHTFLSSYAYAYQPQTFLATNTSVGSKFVWAGNHPSRVHSLKAENTPPNQRETSLKPIGFKGEPMGMAEALFNIYDPVEINPSFTQVLEDGTTPVQQPDPLLGVHKATVKARGNAISQPFIRKHVVNSIIAQAKRMGTDKVSIEPARFRLSGRSVAYRSTKNVEAESGSQSLRFRGHSAGYSALFEGISMLPSKDEGASYMEGHAENKPYMTTPMMGFAWKRLEDGRIVINMTGDHAGYKVGYLGRQYNPTDPRSKIPVGFSITEALGYDPYTGDIAPPNIHLALFGGMSTANYSSEPSGMVQAMSVSGESWRKQIIKSARARMAKGDSIRTRYEGIDANKSGIPWKNARMHVGLDVLMSDAAAHNDPEALLMAYSILGHRTGHQYMSLTLPANATPDMIRAVLNNILIGNATHETYRILSRNTLNQMGSVVPHLGDGGAIYSAMNVAPSGLSQRDQSASGNMTRIRALLHEERTGEAIRNTALLNEIINKRRGADPDFTKSELGVMNQIDAMKKRAEMVLGRNPRLLGDIDAFAEMAVKSDHGYSIPDAERHLTKNGDTTLAIELMFPNRPEMQKFAWDGKEENGVSIVHRGPKAKPTGYFVTYDYQTGIDQYGNPITTKKVVPVKTMAEAEAIRNQFGVKASKAILAQALVAAGMDAPQIKQGVTNADGNVDFSVQDGKFLRANDSGLAMVMSKSAYVGDFDKLMTPTEAKAVSQVLSSGSVLQTQLPSVEVRKANMMIGARDARELEGLLRRKLTFGNGSGPVEFSSKLMRVVAYGRKKTGRDLYPDSMTGAEWYKFLKENTVSKDEMRMTGIVYLLHENNDAQLTRQDLAEFIYTVYPRTSRQVRRQNNSTIISQNRKLKAGSLSGLYNLPFIDDVQTKEDFVVNTHLDNLQKVADLIEQRRAVEETKADAEALADALRKSIQFTVAEMGMPPDAAPITNFDLQGSIEYMRGVYKSSTEYAAGTEGFFGDKRGVRPAQLEYIMRDVVWGRLGDQYKTIENALGDLGFINPYEIEHADQSSEKNPFNPTGTDEARSLHQGVSIMGRDGGPAEITPNPSFSQQGIYFHGGNYHASYATFSGFYQSSPQFVEVTNRRLLEESNRAKATLKERMDHSNDPEQKRKIKSIIDTIERVETVRKLVGGQMADFSHYDNNDQGTFQLGHVRSTEAVLLGEYGIANPDDPAFHGEDPVSGYAYSPEAVIGIEEIQSDSFQYHTFGPPTKPEMALPDSPEQIEGLKLSGDLTKLVETKKRLEASIKDAQTIINQNLRYQMMSTRGDNRMNAMFLMKNFGALSPIELYMLRDDLALKDSGRTMEVPEKYKQYVGLDRIPVYEMPDFMSLREEGQGRFESEDAKNKAVMLGRKMAVQIHNLAVGDVMASLLPDSFMGQKFSQDTFTYREDSSARPQPTASFVFMVLAAQDPEIINKSVYITESQAAMRGASDVDWDAVAARTIDRIESMREKVLGDPVGMEQQHLRDSAGPRASRLARAKFFDNLLTTYRERLTSPRNQLLMAEVMPTGEPLYAHFGQGYEVTPLALEIRNNPSRYSLVSESLQTDKMHPSQLLFPSASMVNDLPLVNMALDFKTSEIAPKEDESPMGLYVQYNAANTALGQFLASSISGLISHTSRLGTVPAEIKAITAKIDELTPKVPIATGNQPKIANSLPYGVEDIYKPVALMGTVLRAANAGFGAITYSDARMQVLRGHSMDIVPTMLIGRQANMLTLGSDSHTAALMSQLYVLPEDVRNQLHGGLFKRLAECDNAFFVSTFKGQRSFEHNGVSGDIGIHFTLAAKEAAPYLLTDGIIAADMGEMSGFWRAVTSNEDAGLIVEGHLGRPHDVYGISGESSMIAPDGKPYKAKDLATDFFKRFYGNVVSGEKNDRQRVIDSAVANAGASTFYWSEQGRAMGYVSQYGAPSWFIKSIMFGQRQAAIDGFSSDAFQRPVVTVANDGTYTLLDPKSGRAIMEKITNPQILREAFFQNSKYLGRLPYIAKFLSEWSPVGAYVTQGHTSGRVYNAEMIKNQLDEGFDARVQFPKKNEITSSFGGVVAGQQEGMNPLSMGNSFVSSASKSMAPFGGIVQHVGAKAWMRHVNKVNVQDPAALSSAMSTYFSCGGPVLRFKPRNPTEAHKKAFRKKIVEGIAMLMPSNGGIGKPQANTETLDMLSRMYNNFTKVTKGRKIPTQGEALEDDDEYSRP